MCVFVNYICLVCIVVILRVFVILCVYCCFTLDAGLMARSQYPEGPADRPPRHRFFLVSLCLQANDEMVPKFPSRYYMLLM
jgi:hypothetical protein